VLPWGHAAVGYLLYTVLCRYRTGETPESAPVLALAVGTQIADLIDKPLAWYLGVIPSGRSLGHSLFTAVVLIAIADWIARRYGRREYSAAFAVGHLSHLAADSVYPILRGNFGELRFLLWPAIPQPPEETETDRTIPQVLIESTFSPVGVFELLLFVLATALWLAHRAPGLWLCLGAVRSLVRRR